MNVSEKKLMDANIKLQRENSDIKEQNIEMFKLLDKIKTYIKVNKDKDDKVNGESILAIIGEFCEW